MSASTEPQVTMTNPVPCRCRLDIEVPAEIINSTLAATLQSYVKEAALPGFRPGKAPVKMIKNRFAAQIQERAREYLLYQTVQAACAKHDVTPETSPIMEDNQPVSSLVLKEGEALKFAVSFDIAPTFEMPDYKSIEVEKTTETVGDEAVNEVVKNLLEQRISYETVDRAAIKGDLLKVTYSAKLEEEIEVSDSAKFVLNATSTWLPLNEPELIPGANDALIGAEVGKNYVFTAKFPENYFEKSLAGKTAVYNVTVEEVQASIIPELNDEIAKQFGVESAEDLQNNIRTHLQDEKNYRADMTFREKVAQKVLEGMEFDLPPETLEDAVRLETSRLFQAEMQKNAKPENVEELYKELAEKAKDNAVKSLRRRYVFKKIAEIEGLKVNPEDIDSVIESLANYAKTTPAEMKKHLIKNERMNELFHNIHESKAIDFVATLIENRQNA